MDLSVFDDLQEEVVIIDRNYRILYANKKYAEDMGYSSPEEVIGDFCYVVSHKQQEPCDGECHPCPLIEIQKGKSSVSVVHTHYTHDNAELPVEILAFPLDGGRKILQIIRNIKCDKEKYYLFSLSQRLSSIGYLALGIAHQLSTPLGTILLSLDDLEKKVGKREEIETIRSAVSSLREYVDRLLLMVRRKGQNDIVDLKKAITDTLSILEIYAKERGVRLESDAEEGVYLLGNEADIRHILLNLILNAIQASEDGSSVWIRSGMQDSVAYIEVEDYGKGIPPEEINRIFIPFYTGSNKKEGTGLGLAIVNGLVKEYGGDIEVFSVPGRGTRFRVTLPIS